MKHAQSSADGRGRFERFHKSHVFYTRIAAIFVLFFKSMTWFYFILTLLLYLIAKS